MGNREQEPSSTDHRLHQHLPPQSLECARWGRSIRVRNKTWFFYGIAFLRLTMCLNSVHPDKETTVFPPRAFASSTITGSAAITSNKSSEFWSFLQYLLILNGRIFFFLKTCWESFLHPMLRRQQRLCSHSRYGWLWGRYSSEYHPILKCYHQIHTYYSRRDTTVPNASDMYLDASLVWLLLSTHLCSFLNAFVTYILLS